MNGPPSTAPSPVKSASPVAATPLPNAAEVLRQGEVLQGAAGWGVLSFGLLLALAGLDGVLHLPAALHLPLALVWAGVTGHGLFTRILRPLLRPVSEARAARLLEVSQGITGNSLINAYHCAKADADATTRRFVGGVIHCSGNLLVGIQPRSLGLTRRLKNWLVGLAGLALVWVVMAAIFPRNQGTAVERIFLPLADVPPVGRWVLGGKKQ